MAFPTNIVQWRFARAMAWSLALHAAMLWPVVMRVPAGQVRSSGDEVKRRLDARLANSTHPVLVAPAAMSRVRDGAGLRAGRVRASPSSSVSSVGQSIRTGGESQDEAGADADDLRTYRFALAVDARAHWSYPLEARQQGQVGTVELRVSVLSSGARLVSVERSSGSSTLDAAALGMLRSAVISARQPDGLRGKAFSLVVPVVFGLDGER